MIDFTKLAAPFDPEKISWRVGSTTADKKKGMALAYLDARDVMARLDEVCGPRWQCRYSHAGQKTICDIGIYTEMCQGADNDHGSSCFEWVWRSDGAGDTDFEADKGALSDAFKRAAVRFGIGRYLYDTAAPWVEIEPMGKSFKIAASEMPKLRKLLMGVPSGPAATQAEVIAGKPLDAAGWKAKAVALVQAADDACGTTDALYKWQLAHQGEIDTIRRRSSALADWIAEGLLKLHEKRTEGKAA